MKKFYSCIDSLIPSPLSEQHLIIKKKAEKEADGTIDDYTAVCLAKGAFHWYIPFEVADDDYDGRIEKLDNPWEILADERKRGK